MKNHVNKNVNHFSELYARAVQVDETETKIPGLHKIHWSAVGWLWLSPSRYSCPKTELNHNLRYRRALRAFLFNRRHLATVRTHRI